jgi:outer membrane biosynthesis protein TonB
MSAVTLGDTIESGAGRDPAAGRPAPELMPSGLALSGALHLGLIAVIVLGLPGLFSAPPPQETPIAVELVTVAPETHATHPNPFRPQREARPIPAKAPPAPKPEPQPHPAAAMPPAAAAPPPPPKPKPAPKPEPVAAKPPPPIPQAKPKLEARERHETPRPEMRKPDTQAFAKLLDRLEKQPPERQPQTVSFDALLKNLTRQQQAAVQDAPPLPHQQAAAAEASSQPKATLGSELTASQLDLLRQQIERCWDVPAGARDAKDLVVEVKAVVNRDGTVREAAVVDTGRYNADPFFRAAADSAKRAVLNPQCTGPGNPLKLPPDQYEAWHILDLFFNPRDLL